MVSYEFIKIMKDKRRGNCLVRRDGVRIGIFRNLTAAKKAIRQAESQHSKWCAALLRSTGGG